MLALTKYFIRS